MSLFQRSNLLNKDKPTVYWDLLELVLLCPILYALFGKETIAKQLTKECNK